MVKDPSGSVNVDGGIIVVNDWPVFPEKGSVVAEIVVRLPSDSVDTDAEIVVSDNLDELEGRVSVVAEIVVRLPSDSVDTDAEIVVRGFPGELGSNVSVEAEKVVNDPSDNVETDAEIVLNEFSGELGRKVSVDAEIVVKEPSDAVEIDSEIVLRDGPEELDCMPPVPPGKSVIVRPSVVIVVGDDTSGRDKVSDPITIGEVGFMVYVEPLIVTTSGEVVSSPDEAVPIVDEFPNMGVVEFENPLLVDEKLSESLPKFVVPLLIPEISEEVPLWLWHRDEIVSQRVWVSVT